MPYTQILWDLDTDPDGNVQHIAGHGVSKDEVGQVLASPVAIDVSRSSGLPIAFGFTTTGRYLAVIYEELDPDTAFPITAYEVPV
ncbi:MAG TPA: hypothetical protein VMT52_06915 [Planctomycetota bacterium]|nr:hypothetical protein [Planctomycetota bacterium]